MPLPSKYKSEKEKPILSLTKGTIYAVSVNCQYSINTTLLGENKRKKMYWRKKYVKNSR